MAIFASLGFDILYLTSTYLDPIDIFRLQIVNKRLRHFVQDPSTRLMTSKMILKRLMSRDATFDLSKTFDIPHRSVVKVYSHFINHLDYIEIDSIIHFVAYTNDHPFFTYLLKTSNALICLSSLVHLIEYARTAMLKEILQQNKFTYEILMRALCFCGDNRYFLSFAILQDVLLQNHKRQFTSDIYINDALHSLVLHKKKMLFKTLFSHIEDTSIINFNMLANSACLQPTSCMLELISSYATPRSISVTSFTVYRLCRLGYLETMVFVATELLGDAINMGLYFDGVLDAVSALIKHGQFILLRNFVETLPRFRLREEKLHELYRCSFQYSLAHNKTMAMRLFMPHLSTHDAISSLKLCAEYVKPKSLKEVLDYFDFEKDDFLTLTSFLHFNPRCSILLKDLQT
jgi:hypothetical protein